LIRKENYAICLQENNLAIGAIGLMIGKNSDLNIPANEAEVGFWLGVPFWHLGFMSEALVAVIHHAFIDLNLEKLWAGYFEGNENSKRLQKKYGFHYVKTLENKPWPLLGENYTVNQAVTVLNNNKKRGE
jgi:RimJ/RimL family protein N-acetyltransferase